MTIIRVRKEYVDHFTEFCHNNIWIVFNYVYWETNKSKNATNKVPTTRHSLPENNTC